MNGRPILYLCGIVLTALAGLMVPPLLIDLLDQSADWRAFLITIFFSLTLGMSLILINRDPQFVISPREAFVMTTASWCLAAAVASVPFMITASQLSPTDAFFEATSGITTTGSTVMTNLDDTSRGILLWRALLQWIGGIGFIVVAIAILPFLKVGGMQLFSLASSDHSDKIMPRAFTIAVQLALLYGFLTLLCGLALWLSAMTAFDAVIHAMTTIATGGFSSHDDSIAFFQNPQAEVIIMIFMIVSSLPFLMYLNCIKQGMKPFWQDGQAISFLLLSCIAVITVIALHSHDLESWRMTAFNTISILTGTGYVTGDISHWSDAMVILLFCLMLIGGCAGSTTCGIKIFRLQIIRRQTKSLLQGLIQPHGVFVPRYQGRALPDDITQSVLGFVFLFFMSFAVLAFSLGAVGLDFQSSMTAAATAIANVGPALGESLGPYDHFANLPTSAKWLMSTGMILGRLELYTVIVLLMPRFWRY